MLSYGVFLAGGVYGKLAERDTWRFVDAVRATGRECTDDVIVDTVGDPSHLVGEYAVGRCGKITYGVHRNLDDNVFEVHAVTQ